MKNNSDNAPIPESCLASVTSSVFSFDDLFYFKEEIKEPINMAKDEFVTKTKKLLAYIESSYGKGWKEVLIYLKKNYYEHQI